MRQSYNKSTGVRGRLSEEGREAPTNHLITIRWMPLHLVMVLVSNRGSALYSVCCVQWTLSIIRRETWWVWQQRSAQLDNFCRVRLRENMSDCVRLFGNVRDCVRLWDWPWEIYVRFTFEGWGYFACSTDFQDTFWWPKSLRVDYDVIIFPPRPPLTRAACEYLWSEQTSNPNPFLAMLKCANPMC